MYSRGLTRLLSGRAGSLAAGLSAPRHGAFGTHIPRPLQQCKYYNTFEGGRIDEDDVPATTNDGTLADATTHAEPAAAQHAGSPDPGTSAAVYPELNTPEPSAAAVSAVAAQGLPVTQFQATLANVASLTGVVQTVLQGSTVSSYSVTLHVGAPAFGLRGPQHIQVLLRGQMALELAPYLRPGMVVHAVGSLQSASKSPVRLVASSVSEVAWDSVPAEVQQFFTLAAQEKPEKPQKAGAAERPAKEPYGKQRLQYDAVLKFGSFELAAEATGRAARTMATNVLSYVEATGPEYIDWRALMHVMGISLYDPDVFLPTVNELVHAVESFRPTANANPAAYITTTGFMKLRPLLEHVKTHQGCSSLWRKLKPLDRQNPDNLYRILQLGRYIADTHLEPQWMASAVARELPRPQPQEAPDADDYAASSSPALAAQYPSSTAQQPGPPAPAPAFHQQQQQQQQQATSSQHQLPPQGQALSGSWQPMPTPRRQ